MTKKNSLAYITMQGITWCSWKTPKASTSTVPSDPLWQHNPDIQYLVCLYKDSVKLYKAIYTAFVVDFKCFDLEASTITKIFFAGLKSDTNFLWIYLFFLLRKKSEFEIIPYRGLRSFLFSLGFFLVAAKIAGHTEMLNTSLRVHKSTWQHLHLK